MALNVISTYTSRYKKAHLALLQMLFTLAEYINKGINKCLQPVHFLMNVCSLTTVNENIQCSKKLEEDMRGE